MLCPTNRLGQVSGSYQTSMASGPYQPSQAGTRQNTQSIIGKAAAVAEGNIVEGMPQIA
jgi:hypothetical protein